MLFYDPASEEYLASVYRKNPYFPRYAVFVTGVSGSGYADDAVGEAKMDVLEDTYVYFSRNLSGREMLSYTSVGRNCLFRGRGRLSVHPMRKQFAHNRIKNHASHRTHPVPVRVIFLYYFSAGSK